MNTSHGFHIDGTHLHKQGEILDCGGPEWCRVCGKETIDEHMRRAKDLEVATLKR